ncbi:hypothetical protein [Candidatus Pelagibacter communis]|jgi:hypothetical protein|uniref:hypothetical protein n=1 Tax=Pelagibacter ubique TaxID=198252 RepID=UPI003EE0A629
MNEEKNIINILILLAISDDELHLKEREFIQDYIDEKNFSLDIDQILEEMKNKFRDDFETSCLFYLNSIREKFIKDEVITLTRKLAAADLIVRDREIKFLELVKKEWKI